MADLQSLNDILAQLNLDEITGEDKPQFEDLPDGYYLCELDEVKLTETKAEHKPMVSTRYSVVENGNGVVIGDDGFAQFVELEHTAKRKIFINYVLTDVAKATKMTNELIRFTDPDGAPLIDKTMFTNQDDMLTAFEALNEIHPRIYIQVSRTEKNGQVSVWSNVVSWKKATELELPQ